MPKFRENPETKDNISTAFEVQFYSLKPISNTLSKARARIFYKGENFNGTFIDEEVADMMIYSLPYCPIKGVYDPEKEDFTQHTKDRSLGKVYGVVPEYYTGGWESWFDEDGVERCYYCCDVILFTALFPEASEIEGKSLSMELYTPTLDGYYERLSTGRMVLHLTHAEFAGLQVLGDDIMPCFEGAGFYSKGMTKDGLKQEIDKAWSEYSTKEQQIGGKKMAKVNFEITDEMAANSLFTAINPKYNEENGFVADYALVNEEEGLVYNLSEGKLQVATAEEKDGTTEYSFADYTFAEPAEPVEEDIVDSAKAIADYALEVEEGTSRVDKFGKIVADYEALKTEKAEMEEKISNYEKEKVESEEKIATLNQEKENLQAEYTKLDEETKAQIEELSAYKANDEKEKKVALIDTYSDKLDKESIDKFVEGVDNYTLDALDRELAFTLVKSNPSLFSKEPDGGLIPKDESNNTGLNAILSKYDK